MSLNLLFIKGNSEPFVKLMCIDDDEQIYALKAQSNFDIFGKHVKKDDISGQIRFGDGEAFLEIGGKFWISEESTMVCGGECRIENSYFRSKNAEIAIENSVVKNSIISTRESGFYVKTNIENSCIENSQFRVKSTFLGAERVFVIIDSDIKNCDFYTLKERFDPSYKVGVDLFEIKNSTIVNVTSLNGFSVINSKANASSPVERVYVDGDFYTKDSELKFTSQKSFIKFPYRIFYPSSYDLGLFYNNYFDQNLTAKKFTTIHDIGGLPNVQMYDENVEGICFRYADKEREILDYYVKGKGGKNESKKIKDAENSHLKKESLQVDADTVQLQSKDNSPQNTQSEPPKNQENETEIEQDERLKGMLKRIKEGARELGLDLQIK